MKKSGLFQLIRNDENKYGLPNFFTLLRIAFLPFIIYFLELGTRAGDWYALALMFLAALTDYLDGHFARKLKKSSDLGRMLDPLIDKVSVGATMFVLAHMKGLPYWYVVIVIVRDLFLLITGTLVISKKHFVIESNKLGKWTSTIFAAVIISFTLDIPYVKYLLMYISLILIPVTVIGYVQKYRHDLKRQKVTYT
ncbi:CDP-alcohol phosphatidyltransferase family protein [candidate division KSB1 bacterium]|nr:CDP-alcohol phosphatidyltransferase family protein [candidate division KSB1 bacterium]RQV99958.1 MAG: CDP-alcohol phosphatidyltransferase family protein [candidate division KSB1 bacterium]